MLNIICTSQAEHIGKLLEERADFNIFFLDKNRDGKRYFPDSEIYVKISQSKNINGRTIIIHAGAPKPNDGLLELKMTLDILRDHRIGPIEVLFTYFPFGMQDHITDEGETNVAENIIKELIAYYKVKKIYTIDAHFWGRDWVKKYPIKNVSAVSLLKAKAKDDYPDLKYLAPDMGSQMRTGIKATKKKRLDSHTTEFDCNNWFREKVKNNNICVVDDLLETGGTMAKFAEECKKNGAKNMIALITHGVLKKGVARIKNTYQKLYLTNTIKNKEANVDISDLIIRTIK